RRKAVDLDDPRAETIGRRAGGSVGENNFDQWPLTSWRHERRADRSTNPRRRLNSLNHIIATDMPDPLEVGFTDESPKVEVVELDIAIHFNRPVDDWLALRQDVAVPVERCTIRPAVQDHRRPAVVTRARCIDDAAFRPTDHFHVENKLFATRRDR